jgi:hypothetical protein
MATPAQITANQANAQLCTGPKTDAGKERSSQNSLKHGLFSTRVVLPYENQSEYDALLAGLTDHYQPVGVEEITMVREVTDNYWKIQRARRVEHAIIESHATSDLAYAEWIMSDDYLRYERIMRMVDRLQNAWHRSMSRIDKLQSARKREELRITRERAAEARTKAADAKRAASESRRKSDEMLQELLMPSDYSNEIGFVPSGADAAFTAAACAGR